MFGESFYMESEGEKVLETSPEFQVWSLGDVAMMEKGKGGLTKILNDGRAAGDDADDG